MIRINENYTKLKASYLFADIAKRVGAFAAAHPERPVIRLGIGDVTEPLPPACIEALHAAADEMSQRATFRGYGPEQGYSFLREAVAAHDYAARGCRIEPDEIFVSDGAKCDCGNIQEIFAADARLAIPDPVYPVYVDTNVMAGRTGPNVDGRYEGILYLDSTPANGYVPEVPDAPADLIYLCFPNNPTGVVATKAQLAAWVDYAKRNAAADPQKFATELAARAGDHQIFLVWQGAYRTLEGQCEAVLAALGQARPGGRTIVVSGGDKYFEPGSVTVFPPAS